MATRGETQFLKVFPNHTMLTPPQRRGAGHDPKTWTACLDGRKPNSRVNSRIPSFRLNSRRPNYIFQRSKSNWRDFKILNFSGPSLLGMSSSTLQSNFLSGGLLCQMVIVISFALERKLHQLTMHLDWDPNDSRPNQTEW